ncbi:protogenin-like isoform X2 [Dermacentor albipictus]|uniref:protogenin-like isoform X2 n=1 Tax=Dermacentor albipictus TaxID=60249 RepID=UPI0038FC441B
MASRITLLCCLLTVASSSSCDKEGQCIQRGINFTRLSGAKLVAVKGEPLLLDCSVSVLPELAPYNITWNHNGKPLDWSTTEHVVLSNGSLFIDQFAYQKKKNGRRDDGTYTCMVHTKAGTMFSRPVQVELARMPKGFTEEPQPLSVSAGSIARFVCHTMAVPAALYNWQRNLEDVPPDDERFTQLSSGALQIVNVTAADAGNYRCIARNAAKTQYSAEASLTVLQSARHGAPDQPPEFLNPSSQELTLVTGDTVELECFARSSQQTFVTWIRQGGALLPEGRSTYFGRGNLRITNLTQSDAGTYKCLISTSLATATETLSLASQSHTLIIYEPPTFASDMISRVRPAARTVRFDCDAQGFPAPEVRWFKDGQPLVINGRIKVMRSEDIKYLRKVRRHLVEESGSGPQHQRRPASNVLVISHPVKRDAGFYQCLATNVAGLNTLAARLVLNASGDQPSPPTGLKAVTNSSTAILLSWNPSAISPGQIIQAYSIHYLPTAGGNELQKVSVNTALLIEKLMPFTNYTFYVRAYSGKSASEQSEKVTQITGEDVPLGAPSVTVTSLTPTTMHISWSELSPTVARGNIALYRIHYRLHGQNYNNVLVVKGTVREYTITGLEPTKEYDVRVMAGTAEGFPALSDEAWPWVTYRMPHKSSSTMPLPPVLYLIVINATTLEARWSVSPEEKNPVLGFKLRFREQGSHFPDPIVLPHTTYSYVVYNLKPQTWYEVHVSCFGHLVDGQETVQTILTHPENLTVEGDVDPPGGLEAEPTSPRSIHLSWKPPNSIHNITYYTVRYSAVHPKNHMNSSVVHYVRSTTPELVVKDLLPYTLYGFAVRSHESDNRPGHFSQLIECRTSEDKPTVPRDITWAPVDLGSIRLNWLAPEFPNGVIQAYHIFYNASVVDITQVDKWKTKKEPGTHLTSIVNGLSINKVYSLRMQAETAAGLGPLTQVIKFVISVPSRSTISPHLQAAGQEANDPSLGILLGVLAGLLCMAACAIIILYKNSKCGCTGSSTDQHGPSSGRSCFAAFFGQCKMPAPARELEVLSVTSPGPGNHLDTKGGYPATQCNGKTNGHARGKQPNGTVPNGHVGNGSAVCFMKSSGTQQKQRTSKDPESRLPLPRSQHRYNAHDCSVQEDGGAWDPDAVPAPTPLLADDSATSETWKATGDLTAAEDGVPDVTASTADDRGASLRLLRSEPSEQTACVILHGLEETKNLVGPT